MACVARTMMWLVWTMLLLAGGGLMKGCENPQTPAITGNIAQVKISGQTYKLEIAATDSVRTLGLGGRKSIDEDGGMIFVFTPRNVRVQEFVMRDCPINIDIIYTDGAGRVLAAHEMKAEAPRGPDEGQPGTFDNQKYEMRLKRYSSKFPATFAIELKEGSIKKLGVKEGDKVEMDTTGLKKMAQ